MSNTFRQRSPATTDAPHAGSVGGPAWVPFWHTYVHKIGTLGTLAIPISNTFRQRSPAITAPITPTASAGLRGYRFGIRRS